MGQLEVFDDFAKGRHVFRGRVKKVLFTDPSSDFYIFWAEDLDNPKDRDKKVKGNFFDPVALPGSTFKSAGSWDKHPKYGPTFNSKLAIPYVSGFDNKRNYLCSNIQSLSSIKAAKIIKEMGPDLFEKLDSDALGELMALNCVSQSEAETIASEYDRLREYGRISRYLFNLRVPSGRVKAIFQELGVDAIKQIHENPYAISLAEGVSFVLADRVALKMGFAPDSEFRIASITEYLLELSSRRGGHLFLPKDRLTPTINSLPSRKRIEPFGRQLSDDDVENALNERIKKDRIVVDEKDRVYLKHNYHLEQDCADIISDMSEDVHDLGVDTDKFIEEYERVYGIRFSDNQTQAIHALNSSKILLVTGLPGTGKSTLAKAFVRLFKYAEKDFVLMSPTGIAAKNIEKIVGEEAGTIHRKLGYDGSSWGYGDDKKYPTDAVLVDEMSMVDQELLYRLLSSLTDDTILVMIGDHAQLPSVGAGNVLHEMIESGVINQVHLTEIFRQSSASDIVINAHRINSGQDLLLKDPTLDETDFRFISIDDPQKIVRGIKHVVKGLFDSSKDHTFQVLSPTYNGSLGVDALNKEIKQLLNPPRPSLLSAKIGEQTYQKEDRVMITKNDYNLNVYNGEVGKLYKVNQKDKEVEVKIFDEPRNRVKAMSFAKANQMLTLAYAMTVHKSQGNQWDYVIMPFHSMFSIQLQRNLLYTAVTRSKKKVFVFGQRTALEKAVENDSVSRRNTAFGERLMTTCDKLE